MTAELKRALTAYPGREDPDASGLGDGSGQELRPGPRPVLRPARAVGDHQRVRHDQHPGAGGVRTHPRAGDAPRDRDEPAADAADDPPRERRHRAHRRRPRPAPRRTPRRAHDPRAGEPGTRIPPTRPAARRLRPARGRGRHRGRRPPRPQSGATQRARRHSSTSEQPVRRFPAGTTAGREPRAARSPPVLLDARHDSGS